MLKFYRQKSNSQTFWAGDIFVLRPDGNLYWLGNERPEVYELEKKKHWNTEVCAFNSKTLKNFSILENWYEEVDIKDIDNTNNLLPCCDCPYFYLSKFDGQYEVIEAVFKPNLLGDIKRKKTGMCFLDEKKAVQMAKLLNIIDLGIQIDDAEANQSGRFQIKGSSNSGDYAKLVENLQGLVEANNG